MRRRNVERKERNRSSSSKIKYTSNCWWGIRAINASASGMTQEIERRSKEDECSGGPKPPARTRRERKENEKGPLCDECG